MRRLRVGICTGVCFAIVAGIVGCGGSGADDLAHQQELANARREAAHDARQSAHIANLSRNSTARR